MCGNYFVIAQTLTILLFTGFVLVFGVSSSGCGEERTRKKFVVGGGKSLSSCSRSVERKMTHNKKNGENGRKKS